MLTDLPHPPLPRLSGPAVRGETLRAVIAGCAGGAILGLAGAFAHTRAFGGSQKVGWGGFVSALAVVVSGPVRPAGT